MKSYINLASKLRISALSECVSVWVCVWVYVYVSQIWICRADRSGQLKILLQELYEKYKNHITIIWQHYFPFSFRNNLYLRVNQPGESGLYPVGGQEEGLRGGGGGQVLPDQPPDAQGLVHVHWGAHCALSVHNVLEGEREVGAAPAPSPATGCMNHLPSRKTQNSGLIW